MTSTPQPEASPQGGLSTRAVAAVLGVSQSTAARLAAGASTEPVRGIDGKMYPRPADPEVRDYIFGRSHYLRHEEGLSVRQIVRALAEEGHRRSVGSVAAYLKDPCEWCSGDASESPEHSEVGQ